MKSMNKQLVTVEAMAQILSIGRTAAWELVRKGTIKSVSIGRSRRVPLFAIQEYIDYLMDGGEDDTDNDDDDGDAA